MLHNFLVWFFTIIAAMILFILGFVLALIPYAIIVAILYVIFHFIQKVW